MTETGNGRVGTGRRRRGARGERLMVERAEFTSYYGRPILKEPTWSSVDIAGYFFLGGLAGAGSVLAAGAQLTGRPATARALKTSSALAIAGSAAALVHDLGRPGRFANMLRVIKPTSPMSVGSWLLAGYGPAAAGACASALTGRLPRLGTLATVGAATLGPAVATYTAVLAADTATPAWHDAHRHLPFVFAASATCAASGMALVASPVHEAGPARRAAVAACAADLAATEMMTKQLGLVGETYEQGKAGRLMHTARILTTAGALGAALLGGRSRTAAVLGGAALLAGSALTRFGVFEAGVASARDPKYTVVPQRSRMASRSEETDPAASA
ncbi:polysulfide reductase NrfD [Actinospica sp. MGRD01-02]|uniref:Polysulfide reductase NrfD n=1 Tax=Actinospica acidithermotolerans TaxID=2828514 RepID=A0A941IET1_9ACTN|nr:NrfD/PsrC family molybdoenzyme membrane anchor subunit [Actinospica acidithermotolerans]MBR7825570.1 polysulfide reductase NrfD [Actinospica acidithermotolerans]